MDNNTRPAAHAIDGNSLTRRCEVENPDPLSTNRSTERRRRWRQNESGSL